MSSAEDKKAEKKRLAEEAKLQKAQAAAAKKEAKAKAAQEKKDAKERALFEKKLAKEQAKLAKLGLSPGSASQPATPDMKSSVNDSDSAALPSQRSSLLRASVGAADIGLQSPPSAAHTGAAGAAAGGGVGCAGNSIVGSASADAVAPVATLAETANAENAAPVPRSRAQSTNGRRNSIHTLSMFGAPAQRPPSQKEMTLKGSMDLSEIGGGGSGGSGGSGAGGGEEDKVGACVGGSSATMGKSKGGVEVEQEEERKKREDTRRKEEEEDADAAKNGPRMVEVVEDDIDEQVGEMTQSDAVANAEYLAHAIEELKAKMRVLHADGTNRGYSEAYQAMNMVGRDQPALASQLEANRLKNRYGNILAYDHSRVVLPVVNDDPDTNYVNANYIDGYSRQHAYIASQGPVPNSFISFWRMVWHTKADTIVMVTHEVENGRMKCHRYWPDPTSSPPNTRQDYGDITVTHMLSEPHKNFILREFEVERGDEKRQLKHFACLSWPDHGVPLTTNELLGFRNAVKKSSGNPDVPIIIHCSAGVGRTGTYIAIDNLVEQCMDRGGPLDVDSVIHKLRLARNHMVQTEVQYMFIFRAVLDALTDLLSGESRRVEMQAIAEATKRAEDEKSKALAAESAAIEAARLELVARNEHSAASAAMVISVSIKDRLQQLCDAQSQWMENYKQSLEEWSVRNQFEAEEYDLSSKLTPVQSRLEALRQKGLLG